MNNPGSNSLTYMMLEYFRRMDHINDELEESQKIAREDKKDLKTEFVGKTGIKAKFLTKKYNEHRAALKAEKAKETTPPADIQTLEQLEDAISGFKGTPLYDAAREALRK